MKFFKLLLAALFFLPSTDAKSADNFSFYNIIPGGKIFSDNCTLDRDLSDPIVAKISGGKSADYIIAGMVNKLDVFYKNPRFNANIRLRDNQENAKKEFESIAKSYEELENSNVKEIKISDCNVVSTESYGRKIIYFQIKNVIVGLFPMDKTIDDATHFHYVKKYIEYLQNQ